MSNLILPGHANNTAPIYATVFCMENQIETAMLQIPSSMRDVHGTPAEEQQVIFFLMNSTKSEHEGMKFTRYELHSYLWTKGEELPDNLNKLDTMKDGYVFFPITLRDGRHSKGYVLIDTEESKFRFRVDNGMYEEVYWSPFGDERGALEQERKNAEINPQLRRYNEDGLDKPDFLERD